MALLPRRIRDDATDTTVRLGGSTDLAPVDASRSPCEVQMATLPLTPGHAIVADPAYPVATGRVRYG